MKRNNFIGLLLFILGSLLLFTAIALDLITGKQFEIGTKQALLLFFGIFIIGIAYFFRFRYDVVKRYICILQDYFREKLIAIRTSFVRRYVISFVFLILVFAFILALFFLYGIEQINSFPDYIGAGTPITIGQLLLSCFGGVICLLPAILLKENKRKKWLSGLIAIVLFLFAAKLWTSLPIATNHFTRLIDSTTQTYNPFSDSRRYDMNIFALLQGRGYGFGSPIQRPVYTLFLTILHVLFNHNYEMIFTAQTIFFSLIPVLLFYLGQKFGNVVMGTTAGLLMIFHEYNQIILSSQFTLVNVQMMMSEIFTALFLILLCLFVFNWFTNIHSKKLAIIAGLGFGIVLLIRTQALVFWVLFVFYFLYLQFWKKEKVVKEFTLFLLAFFIAIIPWMTRNAIQNGNFGLDDPQYLNNILIVNGNNSEISTVEDATILENVANLVTGEWQEYFLRTTSFINNDVVNSLYQFPWLFHFYDLETYISKGAALYPLPYFELSLQQGILLGIQLLVFIFGLYTASKKFGFLGSVPILFYFLYGISGALLGYTGYRFIQPVEWVFLLYWAIGFGTMVQIVLPEKLYLNMRDVTPSVHTEGLYSNTIIGVLLLIIFLLPGIELFIHPKQISLPDETEQYLSLISKGVNESNLQDGGFLFLENDMIGMMGYGLYPVLYDEDDKWYRLEKPNLIYPGIYDQNIYWDTEYIETQQRSNKDILIFIEVGEEVWDIVIDNPIVNSNVENPYLFNNSEVFLFGCKMDEYIDTYYAQIKRGDEFYEIYSGDGIPEGCSGK